MAEWDVVSVAPATPAPAADPWAVVQQAPAAAPAPTKSFGARMLDDVKQIGSAAKRVATLGAKSVNDTVVGTAALPANAAVEAYNLATGKNVKEPGQAWQEFSDADVAPAANVPEKILSAGVSALTGLKVPMPGGKPPAKAPTSMQATVGAARSSGYKALPSEVPGSSPALRAVEKLSGSKQVAANLTEKNVARMSENMATELGMPAGTEINPDTVGAVIVEAGERYGDISKLGAGYEKAIEQVKEARNLAAKYFKQTAANYSVQAEKQAEGLRERAAKIDGMIEKALKADGQPELYDAYVAARVKIAKAYDVMRALVKSRGELDPKKFAQSFGKDKPVTGEIRTAGRAAEAMPGSFSTKPKTGLGRLNNLDNFLLTSGVGLYELAHNPKMAGAAITGAGARALGRKAVASDALQDYMLLTPEQRAAASIESFGRSGVAAQGQK